MYRYGVGPDGAGQSVSRYARVLCVCFHVIACFSVLSQVIAASEILWLPCRNLFGF